MGPNPTPPHRDKPITDDAAATTWANAGGAKRSAPMLPWNMIWWGALRGMLTRFQIGMKYGYQNWKRALSVPRDKWHDGEPGPGHPTDESTLGFVRQFKAHADEHWFQATELMDAPDGVTSPKGDTLADNLYAWLWNVGCAVEYFCENPDLFREAFSKWPVDSPFHRPDKAQQQQAQIEVAELQAKESHPRPTIESVVKDATKDATAVQVMKDLMQRKMATTRVRVGDFEVIRIR
jgi:hypothetical protein